MTSNAATIVRSAGWGDFGPIEVTPALAGRRRDGFAHQDRHYRVVQAAAAAGFNNPVEAVTLRQPLYPGLKEPYYTYAFPTGLFFTTGVNDGRWSSLDLDIWDSDMGSRLAVRGVERLGVGYWIGQ